MSEGGSIRSVPVAADARLEAQRVRFSICTLVTNWDEYREMVASFERRGFVGPDVEYLYLDNAHGNRHEAYGGYNVFLAAARGDYVVLCHQDVLLLEDDRAVLERRLAELDALDPAWALCGNAGGAWPGEVVVRISDPGGDDQRYGAIPGRVTALDENFIVARRAANLALGRELAGFHFHGTELCVVADTLGWSAWVIDFHLRHKSAGNPDREFGRLRTAFVLRWERALRPRWVTGTIVGMFLSGSSVLNRVVYSRHGALFFRPVRKWLHLGRRHGLTARYDGDPHAMPDVTDHAYGWPPRNPPLPRTW